MSDKEERQGATGEVAFTRTNTMLTTTRSGQLKSYDWLKLSNADLMGRSMQDAEYDLRRTCIPRTSVNKGKPGETATPWS